ncbi:MAG: sugar ABC transporter ATP-binding protein [Opitutaceae bacterium]|nr:sugar ABC transporter ATP-binding protein [Opitutaceae bacterium]
MNDGNALEFHGLTKSFAGIPVLRSISFCLREGSTLGLVGENGAGKSTLMNLLGGNLRPDTGDMWLHGERYAPLSPTDAEHAGIAFIHQELNLFPNLTIAENIFLTAFPGTALGLIDRKALNTRARHALQEVGLDVSPDTPVERLSPGQSQLVEIAKALAREARIVIFDEPTTSLSARETKVLFGLMANLRQRGLSMIYISHALDDVMQLCDEIVALRDGAVVGSGRREDFSTEKVISLMVGRSLTQLFPQRRGAPESQIILEARAVSEPNVVRDISFTLRRGEVLGIAGVMGAGRSELARILFGLDSHSEGEILLAGERLDVHSPPANVERGLAFLTEDRRSEGLCLEASVADNLALVTLRDYTKTPLKLLVMGRWTEAVNRIRAAVRLNARIRDDQPARTLSGGNQQKLVLGKWLLARPRVLILDEPTRGIDVGAKHELYQLIHELANSGSGVLLISSEIEELIGMCDRILVMNRGGISATFSRDGFNREQIIQAALPIQREGQR